MSDHCPKCGIEVVLAAVHNQRNGKWTAVPLESAHGSLGNFRLYPLGNFRLYSDRQHEAFDILGQSLGMLPVGVYAGELRLPLRWITHNPSHYLEPNHE